MVNATLSAIVREMKQQDDKAPAKHGKSLPKRELCQVNGDKYHGNPFVKPEMSISDDEWQIRSTRT
jgi:hypothetical protein